MVQSMPRVWKAAISKLALAFVVLLLSAFSVANAATGDLTPRHVPKKPARSELWPGLRSDLLIVKFVEGSRVRLQEGTLVSLAGHDLNSANQLLDDRGDLSITRLFSRSVDALDVAKETGEARSGRELADLNNYYTVALTNSTAPKAEELLDQLNALPIVEIAYAEPIPEPALMTADEYQRGAEQSSRSQVPPSGLDASYGSRGQSGIVDYRASSLSVVTPNFVPQQGYLQPAPLGVDAFSAWTFAGGRGQTVKVIDIELGWNWNHEDLKPPFYQQGVVEYGDHGVAVVGEVVGQDNGFGISGIANGVEIGCHSVVGIPTADVFDQVAATLDPGDVYIIELHCPGPEAGGGGQDGYIALEWWQANFDAISMGTARGVICCEAAGNGAVNFDSPAYEGLFDRNVRDSGAIIVGAAVGTTRVPEWFTNYGARVDLHGWGSSVATTGYGDLQGGNQNQWYTAGFSGTSSATPIVVGSVASLQGAYKAASGGTPLPPGTIAQILEETGTPQAGSNHIGPRPNLAAAIPAALNNLATVEGVVTELGSGAPIEGAELRIVQTGVRTATAADGSYALLVTAGTWDLRATHFGHGTMVTSITATSGAVTTQDVALSLLPTRNLSGRVLDDLGAPVVGAPVSILDTPLPPTLTNPSGDYTIAGVPDGFSGIAEAVAPSLCPDNRTFVMSGLGTRVNLRLGTPNDFEANNGGFTVQSGQWQWGTPNYAEGPTAHSGAQCWGTLLNGPYNPGQAHRLLTGSYDLAQLDNPRLTYWQWFAIWGPYDGANVSISTNNGASWQVIEPVGGYDDSCIDAFQPGTCLPGYTNSSGGWVPGVFDLTPWASQTVRFRFWLEPWGYSNAAGWYIDDLKVHGWASTASVESLTGSRILLSPIEPNPVRGSCSVRLYLPAPSDVNLRLIDPSGRQVRQIQAGHLGQGAHRLEWNGLDETGHAVPAGIYFLQARVGGFANRPAFTTSERVVMLR